MHDNIVNWHRQYDSTKCANFDFIPPCRWWHEIDHRISNSRQNKKIIKYPNESSDTETNGIEVTMEERSNERMNDRSIERSNNRTFQKLNDRTIERTKRKEVSNKRTHKQRTKEGNEQTNARMQLTEWRGIMKTDRQMGVQFKWIEEWVWVRVTSWNEFGYAEYGFHVLRTRTMCGYTFTK